MVNRWVGARVETAKFRETEGGRSEADEYVDRSDRHDIGGEQIATCQDPRSIVADEVGVIVVTSATNDDGFTDTAL